MAVGVATQGKWSSWFKFRGPFFTVLFSPQYPQIILPAAQKPPAISEVTTATLSNLITVTTSPSPLPHILSHSQSSCSSHVPSIINVPSPVSSLASLASPGPPATPSLPPPTPESIRTVSKLEDMKGWLLVVQTLSAGVNWVLFQSMIWRQNWKRGTCQCPAPNRSWLSGWGRSASRWVSCPVWISLQRPAVCRRTMECLTPSLLELLPLETTPFLVSFWLLILLRGLYWNAKSAKGISSLYQKYWAEFFNFKKVKTLIRNFVILKEIVSSDYSLYL